MKGLANGGDAERPYPKNNFNSYSTNNDNFKMDAINTKNSTDMRTEFAKNQQFPKLSFN